jgi:hypothetical protein
VIATACTIETIVEDPLLPILKEDSNITKSTRQIRRPGLDYNPTSPRFKLLMIDFIPYPKVGVFSNVRLYFRRTLCPFLRKKFVQLFFSWRKYTPFTPFPQAEFHQRCWELHLSSFFLSHLRWIQIHDQDTRGSSIQAHG